MHEMASQRWRWPWPWPRPWRGRIATLCASLLLLLLPSLLLLPPSSCPQCSSNRPRSLAFLPQHHKYMWYAPHSGFSNQIGELRNALRIAALLNRTLILPPVTHHHALKLGSCPKSRVIHPPQLRYMAWSHISDLIANSRYVSVADIINITSIVPGLVRTIDFRVFALLWCGADIKAACSGPVCSQLAETVSPWGSLKQCGALVSQISDLQHCCIHAVDDSCATTVWTYGVTKSSKFAAKRSANLPKIDSTHLEKKERKLKVRKDIYDALGPRSGAEKATVLAFGSLFSADYKGSETHIDISFPSGNKAMDAVLKATQFLPFTDIILEAGKRFSVQTIRQPFFCAQLRLLDGQFKHHWNKTFLGLKEKLKKIRTENFITGEKIVIFVMTDLPRVEWSGTYLGDLAESDEFQIHSLKVEDELVYKVAKGTLVREYGLKSGFLPKGFKGISKTTKVNFQEVRDVLLFVEEVICACATLGFQGTSGSTITDNIDDLRATDVCSLKQPTNAFLT